MGEDEPQTWEQVRRRRPLNPDWVERYRLLAEVEPTLAELQARLAAVGGLLRVEAVFDDERITLLEGP